MSLDNKLFGQYMSYLDDARRNFLGAATLTASSLLVPMSAWAAEDNGAKDPKAGAAAETPGANDAKAEATAEPSAKQTRIIPVVRDMTGNLVMGYIAQQAGIDLRKYATDDARKYMTITFGEKSPKTVWVGTNLDNVVLSDQIAWRVTEAGVKPFSKKMFRIKCWVPGSMNAKKSKTLFRIFALH